MFCEGSFTLVISMLSTRGLQSPLLGGSLGYQEKAGRMLHAVLWSRRMPKETNLHMGLLGRRETKLQSTYVIFLLGILSGPEDGDDMYLRNFGLSLNYTASKFRKL
jgi:hypothetical protein